MSVLVPRLVEAVDEESERGIHTEGVPEPRGGGLTPRFPTAAEDGRKSARYYSRGTNFNR